MALSNKQLSEKRTRKNAKRSARRKAVATYKRQQVELMRRDPERCLARRAESPRKLRCTNMETGKRIIA